MAKKKFRFYTLIPSLTIPFALLPNSTLAATMPPNPSGVYFSDVPTNSPYATYIADLSAKKIVSGVGNGQFAPNKTLTRAEMATFLVRAFGIPGAFGDSSHPFNDVQGHWAEPYIVAAYKAGMIAGTSAHTFSPDAPVKREEAALMVWNYLSKNGVQTNQGSEAQGKIDAWAKGAAAQVQNHRLLGPSVFSDWTIPMTRQEAAALIDLAMRALLNEPSPIPQPQPQPPQPNPSPNPQPVPKQGDVYNPTANTTTNLAPNADGTYSPGNIYMDPMFKNEISPSDFDYNMGLFAQIKLKIEGQKITVTLPSTGKDSLTWTIQGGSIINGKPTKSQTPDVLDSHGPVTVTYSDASSIGIGLNDGPKARGAVSIIYKNGQWIARYLVIDWNAVRNSLGTR